MSRILELFLFSDWLKRMHFYLRDGNPFHGNGSGGGKSHSKRIMHVKRKIRIEFETVWREEADRSIES